MPGAGLVRSGNGAAADDDGERRPLLAGAAAAAAAAAAAGGEHVAGTRDGDDDEEIAVGVGEGTFRRNLGTVEAFAIVISIVIGSGVFTSPGPIDTNVPSPGAALLVWLVGGVLAWTGASTMAELGTTIPGEGGLPVTCERCIRWGGGGWNESRC